jgi:hypothetical protein
VPTVSRHVSAVRQTTAAETVTIQAMTTTKTTTAVPEHDVVGVPQPRVGRSAPIRRKLLGAVFGGAPLEAVAVAAFDAADSDGRATSPRGGESRIETQQQRLEPEPQTAEVFAGCLNDIECSGQPSQLPAHYWELPASAPAD